MPPEQEERQMTTIWLSKKTKHRLTKHGNKGMSYDDILVIILDEYEDMKEAKEELRDKTGYYDDDS